VNGLYKLLAKALVLQLNHFLLKIIRHEQIGFNKGHYIFNNVIVVWEGMEWARSLEVDAMFIKIDFEKAYNRVEWSFIIAIFNAIHHCYV
jgi:hypothetical protein